MCMMTPERLRQAGLNALCRELGVVGMVQFLNQFEPSSGDYTAERWQWLSKDVDVESLAGEIQRRASAESGAVASA